MKKILNLLLVFTLAMSMVSCNKHEQGRVYRDAQIDKGIQDSVQGMTQQLISSFAKKDPSVMTNMTVEEIRKDAAFDPKVKAIYKQLEAFISKITLEPYHDFYIVNPKVSAKGIVVSSKTPDLFYLAIQGKFRETYVSFLTSRGGFRDPILAFVYVKDNDQWKLYGFHVGVLRVAAKSALEWFEEGKALMAKGDGIPALLRLKVGKMCLRPVPFMQYEKEKEWNAVAQKLMGQLKIQFPIQLKEVKGSPEIFGLDANFDKTNLVPAVQYVTKIPLEKTAELQTEADAMTAALRKMIPSFGKETKAIFFRAFAEMPKDPKKEYTFYGLKVDIK